MNSDTYYQPPEDDHDVEGCDVWPCFRCDPDDAADYVADLKIQELKEEPSDGW